MAEKVGVKVGEKVVEKASANERKILLLIKRDDKITYKELSKRMGMAEKNIYQNIGRLKKKGLLRRIGPDKGGRWEAIG